MDQSFVRRLYFMLFVFVSINDQKNTTSAKEGPELKDALDFSKNRIDFATGLPDYGFRNYIFIGGWVWDLKLRRNTLDGYEVKVVGIDPNSDVKHGYSIGWYKNETILTRARSAYIIFDSSASEGNVILCVLNIVTENDKKVYINFKLKSNRLVEQTAAASITELFSTMEFRPQVAFYINVTKEELAAIETTVVEGKYESRCYYKGIIDGSSSLVLRNESDPVLGIPKGVLLAAKDYYIRGVFPTQLYGSREYITHQIKGYILLIELCTTHDLPCTGQTSYHYCFVETNDTTPTADGKPCNANKLKDLFGSTSSATQKSGERPDPTPDVPLITTSMSSKLQQTIGKLWWLLIVIIINIV